MLQVITLSLPWPHKDLSPNARVHWRPRAKVIKAARTEAYALMFAGMTLRERGRLYLREKLRVSFTFHPKDKRRRDVDNLISSTKAHRDGIADALGIDDSNFILTAEIGEPRKPACVEVTIS